MSLPAWRVLALLGLVPAMAVGQTQRTMESSRPLRGERELSVRLELSQGGFEVRPAGRDTLYATQFTWYPERSRPAASYDRDRAALVAGLFPATRTPLQLAGSSPAQRGLVRISPEVELRLDAAIAASEATLELGGLQLTELTLTSAASKTTVTFSRPNQALCRTATLAVEAGDLTVSGFGNAGCRQLRLSGGVGRVTLDFSGALPGQIAADLALTMGELELVLPRHAGIRITTGGFLARFSPSGMTREGDVWLSEGYRASTRRIHLAVTSSVGAVSVRWVGGER